MTLEEQINDIISRLYYQVEHPEWVEMLKEFRSIGIEDETIRQIWIDLRDGAR